MPSEIVASAQRWVCCLGWTAVVRMLLAQAWVLPGSRGLKPSPERSNKSDMQVGDGTARQQEHGQAASRCHQICTIEMPSSSLQEDGTLEGILQHRELLTKVLGALCGAGGPKDADDSVRQALAEAVLMLVSCCTCGHARGLHA